MFERKHFLHSRKFWGFVLLTAGILTACGQKQDESVDGAGGAYDMYEETAEPSRDDEAITTDREIEADRTTTTDIANKANEAVTADGAENAEETAESRELKRRFGAECITEQTFEVELSEYDGKVWVVPYAPSGAEDFHVRIMQDEEELYELRAYVPEKLAGEKFASLDAAAFYDVNYDGDTDIVLIETYGDTSFAAVYYGDVSTYSDGDVSVYFFSEERLSDYLTENLKELTIPVIRDFLGNGKKNGEFADYREAYPAVAKLKEMESGGEYKYKLIYFDDDDVPELIADNPGYFVSMYTYHDGRIYTVMDEWGYGAGGNHGYDYCPRKSSVRNYDTDYAGLILWTSYWTLGNEYELELVASIEYLNFIDANGNGVPDGDESETAGYGDKSYIDGVEITPEEEKSYSMGEYEWLGAGQDGMSPEELADALGER